MWNSVLFRILRQQFGYFSKSGYFLGLSKKNSDKHAANTYTLGVHPALICMAANGTLQGCKWNFAGPQIHFQPAIIRSQNSGVS